MNSNENMAEHGDHIDYQNHDEPKMHSMGHLMVRLKKLLEMLTLLKSFNNQFPFAVLYDGWKVMG